MLFRFFKVLKHELIDWEIKNVKKTIIIAVFYKWKKQLQTYININKKQTLKQSFVNGSKNKREIFNKWKIYFCWNQAVIEVNNVILPKIVFKKINLRKIHVK